MKAYLILLFLLFKSSFHSQVEGKYDLNIKVLPSIYTIEKEHVQYMEKVNGSEVRIFQSQIGFSRNFNLNSSFSLQTGLNLMYQYNSFTNLIEAAKEQYSPNPSSYYYHEFIDKPDKYEHSISLNFILGLNYSLKPIFSRNHYLNTNFSINILERRNTLVQTDDFSTSSISSLYFLNNWESSMYNSEALNIGVTYNFNLFKAEMEKKLFLILGLNYEINNIPDIYDFRLFSTVGLSYQFGEFKPMKKD